MLHTCLPCFNIVGSTQEGVVCENLPRNESAVICQCSSMDGVLHVWSVADCDSLHFSPGQTEHRYCDSNNVTIDGHGTVRDSSFLSDLDIVIRDSGFIGTVDCSIVQNDTKTSIGNFTISGT